MRAESDQPGPVQLSLADILRQEGKSLSLGEAVEIASGLTHEEYLTATRILPLLREKFVDEMWLAIGKNKMELTPDRNIRLLGE